MKKTLDLLFRDKVTVQVPCQETAQFLSYVDGEVTTWLCSSMADCVTGRLSWPFRTQDNATCSKEMKPCEHPGKMQKAARW